MKVASGDYDRVGVGPPQVLSHDPQLPTERLLPPSAFSARAAADGGVDDHLVSDRDPFDPFTEGIDDTGAIRSGYVGKRRLGAPAGHPQVHVVQGGSANTYPRLAGSGDGILDLDQAVAIDVSDLGEDPGPH
jgi:hypothetical protein